MASPVRMKHHGRPHSYIVGWLVAYVARHSGIAIADNATVALDADNEFQPDAILLREEAGGAVITDDDYVEGAPELVVEVAASSVSHDLHQKMRVYRRAGVQEYIVWRVLDGAVDWFQLNEGVYESLSVDADGVIESHVFPGLRLPVQALIDGDLASVLAAVR